MRAKVAKAEISLNALKEHLAASGDVVLTPDFVSIAGSVVEKGGKANDVDLVIRNKARDEGLELVLRKVFDPEKRGYLHYIYNAAGPHASYIPAFDLVLRPKKDWRIVEIKADTVKIDLGCGKNKPDGYIGIDKEAYPGVDIVHDLEAGLPFPDDYAEEIRAIHVLEHLADREKIMAEVWRVLKPGGKLVFEVPSAAGPGAFAHPGHKSYWNRESFAFWTNPELREGRPPFGIVRLEERREGELVYVAGELVKVAPEQKAALRPIARFTMQKPAMKLYHSQTEAFKPDEIWPWVERHLKNGVVAEEKLNGFRACLQKAGKSVSIFFEDSQEERADKLPDLAAALKAVPDDFILDTNIGVVEEGEPWPRVRLMTLTADRPELPENARVVATVFDLLYWEEDIQKKPFAERRRLLEEFYAKFLKGKPNFAITDQMAINSKADLEAAWKKLGGRYMSEGIVLKDLAAPFSMTGATDALAKVKHAVEIKAIVLDVKRNRNGTYGFRGGLLSGDAPYVNTVEFRGKKYIDMQWSYNAAFKAEPGDVVTFEVEEIIIRQEAQGLVLDWLGAKPLDIDRARREPYYANQVVDLARRGGVLQDARVEKALPKPISSPGGKDAWLQDLLKMVPPHRMYVEPYVGGGSLFWAKEASELEVIADINPDIVAVYRFLRNGTDEDFAWLRKQKWDWSVGHFNKLKQARPSSLRERAYRYKYLNLYSIRGECNEIDRSEVVRGCSGKRFLANLEKYRERLKGVVVLQRDALEVMRDYDSPDTFFYLDPPWKPIAEGQEWHSFDKHAFETLVKELKGKVLISYQGELDLGGRFRKRTLTRAQGGIATDSTQQLYWNTLKAEAAPGQVIAAWQAALKQTGLEEKPERGRRGKFYVAPVAQTEKGDLWRVMDGWGEWYILAKNGDAKMIAVKWPDIGAFHADDGLGITKADVKRIGWSNQAWDRLLTERLEKARAPRDEGETRAEHAERFWRENWYKLFPKSGRGRFIYQHHWRGLSEEEARLGENELLKTEHSLHGDLRFESRDGLWGISVFLGTTEENRKAGGDRLIALGPDDNLQCSFKLQQPKEWLQVGDPPLVVEPGGPGATKDKYAKFFMIDKGEYEIGVWREHMFEVFLYGEKLKGRLLFTYAPVAEKRVWLVDKPKDQRPYAKTHEREEVIEELRNKGQRYLVWAKPGQRPELIDLKEEAKKSLYIPLTKVDHEQRLVYGIVLEPETVDGQHDIISEEEIRKACWRFMEQCQKTGVMHRGSANPKMKIRECYIAPVDFELGGESVKKGSWILAVGVYDDMVWKEVVDGRLAGFSIQGTAAVQREAA